MNPEIKKKWVDALRSGEYEQGKNFLRENDRFCCLGVLCDLHAREQGGDWYKSSIMERRTRMAYLNGTILPPLMVLKWAGLKDDHIYVDYDNQRVRLQDLNDGFSYEKVEIPKKGLSFQEIADLIEQQL